MGRIFLTNNFKWDESLSTNYNSAGFKENINIVQSKLSIRTYSKLNFQTENIFFDGNDFAACAGTLIYKGLHGKQALEHILKDSFSKDLKILRQSLLGCYVLVIKHGNIISISVDESGIYAYYYYQNHEGDFILNDTYWHIAKETKQSINRLAFIENELNYCILDSKTPFKNIYRLLRNEELIIDIINNKFEIKPIVLNKYELEVNTIDEIAKFINDTTLSILKQTKQIINNPILFATGGVDSRLILANYIKANISPKIASWYNSHISMNTKDEDKDCVCEIAKTVNLPFVTFDMQEKENNILTNVDIELINKLGEHAFIYNGNKNWHKILNNKSIGFADYGYFGETLKGWSALDCYDKNVTLNLDTYLNIYNNRSSTNIANCFDDYSNFNAYIKQKYENIIIEEGLTPSNLTKEDIMRLYCRYRLHADTVVYQYANFYTYAYPIYAQKKLVDYINEVDYSFKENEKLNLLMQKKLNEDLLKVQFFSHCRFMFFDNQKLELRPYGNNSVKNLIKKVINKTKYGNKIIELYNSFRMPIKSPDINLKLQEIISTSNTFNSLGLKQDKILNIHLPSMIKLMLTCNAFDNLA